MSNDFGGGFDATDEDTKVAAPPLAKLTPPADPSASPVATAGQPTDGIGIRQYTAGRIIYEAGAWTEGLNAPSTSRRVDDHPVVQAGTQPIDSSKPLT